MKTLVNTYLTDVFLDVDKILNHWVTPPYPPPTPLPGPATQYLRWNESGVIPLLDMALNALPPDTSCLGYQSCTRTARMPHEYSPLTLP